MLIIRLGRVLTYLNILVRVIMSRMYSRLGLARKVIRVRILISIISSNYMIILLNRTITFRIILRMLLKYRITIT